MLVLIALSCGHLLTFFPSCDLPQSSQVLYELQQSSNLRRWTCVFAPRSYVIYTRYLEVQLSQFYPFLGQKRKGGSKRLSVVTTVLQTRQTPSSRCNCVIICELPLAIPTPCLLKSNENAHYRMTMPHPM